MAYVVTQPCHDCKYTDCVVICPCECFYQDESMLYIDGEDCIDCGACLPECPVEAIYGPGEVPAQWVQYVQLNADRAAALKAAGRGHVTEKQTPLEGPGCRRA
jgi:ferredoxin